MITVVENPVVNRILFEGNKRLKEEKILPEIRLAPRQIFTRSKVRADVERIAQAAVERFGRIDTWVNNAGGTIYGRLDQVSEEDSRRLFDINFWAALYMIQGFKDLLIAARGVVANNCSMAAVAPCPYICKSRSAPLSSC